MYMHHNGFACPSCRSWNMKTLWRCWTFRYVNDTLATPKKESRRIIMATFIVPVSSESSQSGAGGFAGCDPLLSHAARLVLFLLVQMRLSCLSLCFLPARARFLSVFCVYRESSLKFQRVLQTLGQVWSVSSSLPVFTLCLQLHGPSLSLSLMRAFWEV